MARTLITGAAQSVSEVARRQPKPLGVLPRY